MFDISRTSGLLNSIWLINYRLAVWKIVEDSHFFTVDHPGYKEAFHVFKFGIAWNTGEDCAASLPFRWAALTCCRSWAVVQLRTDLCICVFVICLVLFCRQMQKTLKALTAGQMSFPPEFAFVLRKSKFTSTSLNSTLWPRYFLEGILSRWMILIWWLVGHGWHSVSRSNLEPSSRPQSDNRTFTTC